MRVWLKDIRKELGLTKTEVSQKANVSIGYYCDIENSKRNPSIAMAKQIAESLNFDWQRFFE